MRPALVTLRSPHGYSWGLQMDIRGCERLLRTLPQIKCGEVTVVRAGAKEATHYLYTATPCDVHQSCRILLVNCILEEDQKK